jgi:toxin ParE1/3/4
VTFAVRYTRAARRDIREIVDYIEAEAGRAIAVSVARRIRAKIETLERNAQRYRERTELGHGRRALSVAPYLIFYRISDSCVFIQRVLHGARDITPDMFPS